MAKVKVGESHERLMHRHRRDDPHSHLSIANEHVEAIAGVLAFCAGAAIGRGSRAGTSGARIVKWLWRISTSAWKPMVSSMANTSLILPDGMQ
jgi:hypothetical protein